MPLPCRRARASSREPGGRRIIAGSASGVLRRRSRPRHGAQGRRHASRSTCSGAMSPRPSPICARSTGPRSISTSRSCCRRARSTARRRPSSPPRARRPARRPRSSAPSPTPSPMSRRSASRTRSRRSARSSRRSPPAVRVTAVVTLAAGALVLAGAIAASQRRRVYEAVVLKVLGATRRQVAAIFLIEYGLSRAGLGAAGDGGRKPRRLLRFDSGDARAVALSRRRRGREPRSARWPSLSSRALPARGARSAPRRRRT